MNCKRIIPLIFVLFQSVILFGQTVDFSYDDNGGRLTRTLTVEQLKSGNTKSPLLTPKSLELPSTEFAKTAETVDAKSKNNGESEDGELKTSVYPNPNRGLIKIDISNMPSNSINEVILYDLYGTQLMIKRHFENNSEIDVSQCKNGTYILRIKINERIFNWKVVKSQ